MERIVAPASTDERAAVLDAAVSVRHCLQGLIRSNGPDVIEYGFTEELISAVKRWAAELMATIPWEFPEALAVGPIMFSDLRKFWGAVLVISNTPDMAHLISMEMTFRSGQSEASLRCSHLIGGLS